MDSTKGSREAEVYAPESRSARIGGEARGLAMEQLSFVRVRRGWAGSDQRLEMVGEEDSGQDRGERVIESPHFSRKRRARNGAPGMGSAPSVNPGNPDLI